MFITGFRLAVMLSLSPPNHGYLLHPSNQPPQTCSLSVTFDTSTFDFRSWHIQFAFPLPSMADGVIYLQHRLQPRLNYFKAIHNICYFVNTLGVHCFFRIAEAVFPGVRPSSLRPSRSWNRFILPNSSLDNLKPNL